MAQKPKIQYVGQFYVYGSEAQKVAEKPKKAKTTLPKLHLERLQRIYVDPIALCGLVVAVLMLAVMVLGAQHLRQTRDAYDRMNNMLTEMKRENAALSHEYHTSYNLEEIREAAEHIGMVEGEEASRYTVFVRIPEHPAEPTLWDDLRWFLSGLFANARKS